MNQASAEKDSTTLRKTQLDRSAERMKLVFEEEAKTRTLFDEDDFPFKTRLLRVRSKSYEVG